MKQHLSRHQPWFAPRPTATPAANAKLLVELAKLQGRLPDDAEKAKE